MRLATRTILLSLGLAVLPLMSTAYFLLKESREILQQEALNRMDGLAEKKSMQVRQYLAERLQDVRLTARSHEVTWAAQYLAHQYRARGGGSAAYASTSRQLHRYFGRYVEESGLLYDVLLIDTQGEVIYSQQHEADFGTNLLHGKYRDSQLAKLYRQVNLTLEPAISAYEYYAPSNAAALFIAAPVIVEGKFKAVLAIQLGNHVLMQIADDLTGLGASGETVFVRREGEAILYALPPQHHAQIAMALRLDAEMNRDTPLYAALSGRADSGMMRDHRGGLVAAAWRYLPEVDWGVAVKIDAQEIMAPIERQQEALLEVLLLIALVAVALAWYFSRQISQPLRALERDADALAQGQLNHRADESMPGELGVFARTFNRMANTLQDLYLNLEAKIEQRTEELAGRAQQLDEGNAALQQEIAERREIERALRASQAQVVQTLEALRHQKYALDQHAIVAVTDVQGTITYVNQQFTQISGYTQQELLGQNHRLLNSGTHDIEFFREMYRAIAAGKVWHGEICNRAKGGHLYWVLTTIVPYVGLSGKPEQYIAIRQDITERKRIEQELQAERDQFLRYFETTAAMMVQIDRQGQIVMVNEATCTTLGYARDELLGKNWFETCLPQPEGQERFLPQYLRMMAGEEMLESDSESVALRQDGKRALISWRRSLMTSRDGVPLGMMGSGVDITDRLNAQVELMHGRELLNESQRLSKVGSWELDLVNNTLLWTDEIYRIFELDPFKFEPTYENFLNVIHPEDRNRVNQAYTDSLVDHKPYDVLHRLRFNDGRIKWVREHCFSEFGADGKPIRSVGAVQDITVQKQYEDELRVAAVAFETQVAIMVTDAQARILRVNKAFEQITGYCAFEVLGDTPSLLKSDRHDKAFYAAMWTQLLETGSWSGEIWDRRKNGEVYPKTLFITAVKDAAGKATEYVANFSDITERKRAEEEIRNLAFYDTLTKLPNRRMLMDRFQKGLSASARSQHYGAVLFMDMDRFKIVNDTLGHDYGDMLLIEVANRIQASVRESDTVARLGGDEFVVLVEDIEGDSEEASRRVAVVAEKIRAALAYPYFLKNYEHHSSPSIGVCLFRGFDPGVDELLKRADMAMYQAKEAGRNAVHFFDPEMQHKIEQHATLENELRLAVSQRQLQLYFQVQVDSDRQPVGAEALLRWPHPVRGMVSPVEFIPLAEESSLILDIGGFVLEEGCRQLVKWGWESRTRDLTLSVNVSAQQIMQDDFVAGLKKLLEIYEINPSRLKLELTESVVLGDINEVIAKMTALHELGVQLSLDDFGTGYSSLAYLKRLPLNQIKVDQHFVRDITSDVSDAMMVQAIIQLAQNFDLEVISEGVETEEQLTFLMQSGCRYHQGYLFSKPLDVDAFEALLSDWPHGKPKAGRR